MVVVRVSLVILVAGLVETDRLVWYDEVKIVLERAKGPRLRLPASLAEPLGVDDASRQLARSSLRWYLWEAGELETALAELARVELGLPWGTVRYERDGQGRVTARVEGPLDRTELDLLVKRVLGLE